MLVFWVQKTVGWPPRAVSAAKFPQIFLTTCVEHDGCLWEALLDHPLGYLERQEGVTMWRISDAPTRKRHRSRWGKGGRGRQQPHASSGGNPSLPACTGGMGLPLILPWTLIDGPSASTSGARGGRQLVLPSAQAPPSLAPLPRSLVGFASVACTLSCFVWQVSGTHSLMGPPF